MADNTVQFHRGPEAGIQAQIDAGKIDGSDLVITSDTDALVFVDNDKKLHTLGSSKTKAEIVANTGGQAIGGIQNGDTIAAGTSLDDFIKKLLLKRVPATYTQPTVSLASNVTGNREVGEKVSVTLTGSWVKNDAGALTKLEVKQAGVDTPLISGTTSPQATTQEVTVPDGNLTFNAVVTYAEGAVKKDNLGDDSPNGHIAAGSKTSANVTISGKRKAFYGTGVGEVPAPTSAGIRALSGSTLAPANGSVFKIPVAIGQQYVVFAYPATLRDVNQVMYVETNDTGMASSFAKSTIAVEGANGAKSADYKVYSYGMAAPAAAPMTFQVTI